MAGGKLLETVGGPGWIGADPYNAINLTTYSALMKNAPGYTVQPAAVVNDGLRRYFLLVNDAFNPQDSSTYSPYPSYAQTVTVNITAWGVSVSSTLVHNVVAAGSMGEVGALVVNGNILGSTIAGVTVVNGIFANVTLVLPAYSTSSLVAPAVPQTEADVTPLQDVAVNAGNLQASFGSSLAPTLCVSTSNTANHEGTSVALIKFPVSNAATVVTAVLELTVTSSPAADMPLLLIGLNPANSASSAWSEATTSWLGLPFAVTPLPSGGPSAAITTIAQNFARLDNGNVVAGHVTVHATDAPGTVKRVDVTEFVRSSAGGSATFVLARRLRNSAYYGNANGSIPADGLSSGAAVCFASKDTTTPSTTPAPNLRIMSGQVVPAITTTFALVYTPAATPAGRRRLLASGAADPLLSDGGASLAQYSKAFATAQHSATSVSLSLAGYAVRGVVVVANYSSTSWSNNVQRILEQGLAHQCSVNSSHAFLGQHAFFTASPGMLNLPGFCFGASLEGFTTLSAALACAGNLSASLPVLTASIAGQVHSAPHPVISASGVTVSRIFSATAALADASDASYALRSLQNTVTGGTLQSAFADANVTGGVAPAGVAPAALVCPSLSLPPPSPPLSPPLSPSLSPPHLPPPTALPPKALSPPQPKASLPPQPKASPPPVAKPPPPKVSPPPPKKTTG